MIDIKTVYSILKDVSLENRDKKWFKDLEENFEKDERVISWTFLNKKSIEISTTCDEIFYNKNSLGDVINKLHITEKEALQKKFEAVVIMERITAEDTRRDKKRVEEMKTMLKKHKTTISKINSYNSKIFAGRRFDEEKFQNEMNFMEDYYAKGFTL